MKQEDYVKRVKNLKFFRQGRSDLLVYGVPANNMAWKIEKFVYAFVDCNILALGYEIEIHISLVKMVDRQDVFSITKC